MHLYVHLTPINHLELCFANNEILYDSYTTYIVDNFAAGAKAFVQNNVMPHKDRNKKRNMVLPVRGLVRLPRKVDGYRRIWWGIRRTDDCCNVRAERRMRERKSTDRASSERGE